MPTVRGIISHRIGDTLLALKKATSLSINGLVRQKEDGTYTSDSRLPRPVQHLALEPHVMLAVAFLDPYGVSNLCNIWHDTPSEQAEGTGQQRKSTFGTKSQTSSRSSGAGIPSIQGSSSPSASEPNPYLPFDCRECWKRESIEDAELECEARGFRGEALFGVLFKDARERRGVVGVTDVLSNIVDSDETRMQYTSVN